MIIKIRGLEIMFSFSIYLIIVFNFYIDSFMARIIIFDTIYLSNLFIYNMFYNMKKGD